MPGSPSFIKTLQRALNMFHRATWLEQLEKELEFPADKQEPNLNIAIIRGILYYGDIIPKHFMQKHAELLKEVLLRCAAEPLVSPEVMLYTDSALHHPHSYYSYKPPFSARKNVSIGAAEVHAYLYWSDSYCYALDYTFCDVLGEIDHGICRLETNHKHYEESEKMQVVEDPKTKVDLICWLKYQRLNNSTIISNAKTLLAQYFPDASITPPIPDLSRTKMYVNIRTHALEFRATPGGVSIDNLGIETKTCRILPLAETGMEIPEIVIAKSHPNLYSLVYPAVPSPVAMHTSKPVTIGSTEHNKNKNNVPSLNMPLLPQGVAHDDNVTANSTASSSTDSRRNTYGNST